MSPVEKKIPDSPLVTIDNRVAIQWATRVLSGTGIFLALLLLISRLQDSSDWISDSWIQLLLVAASWFVAALMTRESLAIESSRPFMYALGGVSAIALVSCASSIAIGVSMVAPIALVAGMDLLARNGNQRAVPGFLETGLPVTTASIPAGSPAMESDDPIVSGFGNGEMEPATPETDLVEIVPEAIGTPVDDEEMDEEAANPVWQAVQDEFIHDPDLHQNLTRWETADGQHTVMMTLRCKLLSGSPVRIHLPVWPFLPGMPESYCRALQGPPVDIQILQQRPGGLVLDVKPLQPIDNPDGHWAVLEIIAVSDAAAQSTPAA